MLNTIRHSIFTRFLGAFLALHLLNVSVDNPDPKPFYIPEDLSFNDQESIVEFVIETLLGYENAIAEYDDPDTDKDGREQSSKIDWVVSNTMLKSNSEIPFRAYKNLITYTAASSYQSFFKLLSPPPEV